jgi:hypothetical protein
MVTDRNNYDLIRPLLIDQAVREATKQHPSLINIKRCSDMRELLDQVNHVLLVEGLAELDRLRRIVP